MSPANITVSIEALGNSHTGPFSVLFILTTTVIVWYNWSKFKAIQHNGVVDHIVYAGLRQSTKPKNIIMKSTCNVEQCHKKSISTWNVILEIAIALQSSSWICNFGGLRSTNPRQCQMVTRCDATDRRHDNK